MKKDSKMKTLEEVCSFINGLWKGKKPPYVEVGVIRNKNFTKEGTLDFSDIAYLDVEQSQYAKRKLEFGDIILEKSGGGPKQPVGRVVMFDKKDGEFSFSNFTSQIRVKNKEELDCYYLYRYLHYYYLTGLTENLQKHSTGIRNLQLKEYKQITIPIPPLSEQHRLVKMIEETFEAIEQTIENTKTNLQNSMELFESYVETVFSNPGENWEEKELGEVINIKHGFAFKSEFFSETGEYVLLTPGNFYEKGGYRDRGEKQKYYIGEIPENFILAKGDILIAMTEQAAGLLGSPIIIPESNKFLHNQRLGLILFKENFEISTKFLFYLFNTKRIRSLIHESASGVKVRHTSPKKVMELKACFPPLTVQQSIAEKLETLAEETKKLEQIYAQKLANLDELKRSILQKAFNGEL
ncbi:restriction endonuclease subunit S [Alkalihalobacterium chitinilyticum]|uniref:Restriction endonuclease subunit S n=1 Tax=Alkalihalobacterium chitinilyticum TaxID=2980103 RepID=A0ABT5VJI4_9BACI|nr:restriction endonuclease subunit S [Alkalihalobacterium chitinilyticum]MDE5415472.1 restriction endonuclease subunit S [Alkalihalobacterium chitinilyticum]